ncbi:MULTISPECIES: ABC transporter permease [unclassified Polaromonas]|jgi:NitT/TauT family transport system permease protein|uniref:ABC transporter permease n=1 Tax=unclassified Polaromonas TaxID=2638319 RepID=UPI0025F7AE3E|nr:MULTISPECIES: ABC transporter permease [unclassified Polaromonas]HQR97073.1 ABC transporter permease [Polaromonas sp.]HQS39023.1 ABC transporter permease [Polaromonas sp.]HQT06219.1 ABC transporter permease [Polaromonas sp.]
MSVSAQTMAEPAAAAALAPALPVTAQNSPAGWRGATALALVVPVLLLLLWWAWVKWSGTMLIPLPQAVAVMMWDFTFGGVYDDAFSATLLKHLSASTGRVFFGFGLAALAGIPLGLMLGRSQLLRMMLDPMLSLLRPIPVTAWLPLAMIFFGLGANSAIFLVFLGAFYPIMLNTVFGVRSVDPRLFEAAAMLGCTGTAQFRSVTLRGALPSIFNGLRLGLSFAWILIVVGEMTGVQLGLGAVIMDARTLSRTDLVITGMIFIGIAGFLCDRVIVLINNRLMRWSPQHHA